MNDELKRAFVAEATEAITTLNNQLLALEEDPTDQDAIDAIFRRTHTLKGNFGAMGFDEASSLAHAMEDVLDDIRADRLTIEPSLIDKLFDGLDRLDQAVRALESNTQVDDIALESTIKDLREELDNGQTEAATIDQAIPIKQDDFDVFVTVDLGEMPAVDLTLILERLEQELETFTTSPTRDSLETGDCDEGFFLACENPDHACEVLANVSSVSACEQLSAADRSASPTADSTREQDTTTATTGISGGEIRSIRVDADTLDALHSLVETLVTARITIDRGLEDRDFEVANDGLGEFDKALAEMQDRVMNMRLIPLETVFNQLPRLVRDLSREMEKEVDLTMTGTDVELDRTIVNRLDDPLVHILRNAVDHGIEPPDERKSTGKPPTGHIEIAARREREMVTIEISDDGAGLDADEIRHVAETRNVRPASELASMADHELYDLIFEPGFSTAAKVTDVSGRGVGMDAVSTTIAELDGSIDVDSTPGEGTTVRLRLPVEVAIDEVLFVTVNDARFGVPIRAVAEVIDGSAMTHLSGTPVLDHEDELVPVIDLADTLDAVDAVADGGAARKERKLVKVRDTVRTVALACDDVTDQEEVVVRPLDGILRETAGISGTAVLGDGNVVPIIDVKTL